MQSLKAKQASLLNENYKHVEFKKRIQNEGDTNLARKFEKRFKFQSSRREMNTAENFNHAACDTDLEPQYSRKELCQRSLALTALVFRDGCAVLIAGQFQSPGQKRLINLQKLRGQPDGFSWLVLTRAEFGTAQVKIFNSLKSFSQGQNCWRQLVFRNLSFSSAKKKKPRYNHVVLCSCAGFLLLAVLS